LHFIKRGIHAILLVLILLQWGIHSVNTAVSKVMQGLTIQTRSIKMTCLGLKPRPWIWNNHALPHSIVKHILWHF